MFYLLIALFACLIGAISGLGGGIIIKPLLDLFTNFSAPTISILSSFTVFAMASASIIKHLQDQAKIEFRLGMLLSLGALAGGNVGNDLFRLLLSLWGNAKAVTLLQNLLLSALLLGVLLYMNLLREKKTVTLKNPMAIVATGLGLGTIASFLGIGGGPINMLVLTLLFSMRTKTAAVNSLLLIFFSQGSKLLTVFFTGGFAGHDLSVLWLIIPAAILGGLVGTYYHKKLSAKNVLQVFNGTLIAIIGIGAFNSIRILVEFF